MSESSVINYATVVDYLINYYRILKLAVDISNNATDCFRQTSQQI
jgi:hypothetical protein